MKSDQDAPEKVERPRSLVTDNWKKRRRVMYLALLFIAGTVQEILLTGADTSVNQQAIVALIAAGAAVIGSYVFGATWEDIHKRRSDGDM